MPIPVQLIYSDNPGSLPAAYTIPPGADITLQSIVARFDGATAASAFIPTLSVYSQEGRLMARVRPDQVFQVGDTGVVTFAPFLRRRLTGQSLNVVGTLLTRPLTDPQSIASSTTPTDVSWTTVEFDTSGFFNPLAPTIITMPQTGVYIIFAAGSFVTNAAGSRHASIARSGSGVTSVSAGPASASFFWAGAVGVADQFDAGETVKLRVAQDSGAALDTGDMYLSAFSIGTL